MSRNNTINVHGQSNEKKYSDADYTNAVLSLDSEQREVFDNFIKRGYKTKWLYVFARNKGLLLTEEELSYLEPDEINMIEQDLEWILLDYKDHLERNPDVRCKCGRALRYEYKVSNVSTGQIFVLGSNHFEQYTNISSEDVKNISNNFRKIDLEKIELLEKVIENRDRDIISRVNKGFILPKDVTLFTEVDLPLLDRQINRLKRIGAFSDYEDKIVRNKPKYTISKTKIHRDEYYEQRVSSVDVIGQVIINKPPNNNLSKPDYIIDIPEMIHRLETHKFSLEDTEKYLYYLTYYKSSLDLGDLNKDKIRKMFYGILGGLKVGALRYNLVEIQDILEKISMRNK